jgi:adenylyltransferase/sulfurtransferase
MKRHRLTDIDLERYDRQILAPELGVEGQEKLKKAKIFIAGAGGLGCPVSLYLAAAGVGEIRLVDNGRVELSNLNRQVLHWAKDIGREKVDSAREKLQGLNADVCTEAVVETITEDNVFQLVADCDLIIDAMDNFGTRYLLNRVALAKNIPLFHGAVYGFEGRATTIIPGETACFRCLYREAPPPVKFPVIGVAPAVIGCIQATEVIKYITGIGQLLANRLLIYDGSELKFTELRIKRVPNCIDCAASVPG